MIKKTTAIVVILFFMLVVATTIQGTSVFDDITWPWKGAKETAESIADKGIMTGVGGGLFNPNGYVTNEQALIVFSRLMEGVENLPLEESERTEYIKETALKYNVNLPSDLVYSRENWELTWRDILIGRTVFEKLGDGSYSVTLIPSYFKIYLLVYFYFKINF